MNIFENINELKAIYNGEKFKKVPRLNHRKKKQDFSFLDVITHIVGLAIEGTLYCRNMVFEMLEHLYDIIVGVVLLCIKHRKQKQAASDKSGDSKPSEPAPSQNRYSNVKAEGEKKTPIDKKEAYRAKKLELKKYMKRNMYMMMHDMEE
jgi:hypothetical protein